MGWLRKERDLIGLVVVWTILLQSIVLPFTTGLHAAMLVSGEASILCTSRGVAVDQKLPAQDNQKPDCQCCHMACRLACTGSSGILPTLARVPLPSSAFLVVAAPRPEAPALRSTIPLAAQPRAPPLA
ncbi:MAG: hypothetical protein R3D30_07195 [Hyphomicrobiales bacterium]